MVLQRPDTGDKHNPARAEPMRGVPPYNPRGGLQMVNLMVWCRDCRRWVEAPVNDSNQAWCGVCKNHVAAVLVPWCEGGTKD